MSVGVLGGVFSWTGSDLPFSILYGCSSMAAWQVCASEKGGVIIVVCEYGKQGAQLLNLEKREGHVQRYSCITHCFRVISLAFLDEEIRVCGTTE